MASRIQRHTPQQIRRILGLETDSSSDNDIDTSRLLSFFDLFLLLRAHLDGVLAIRVKHAFLHDNLR
eukprot:CAMPEP_0201113224 /NCGR_PEP_ID=MMETSP0812-20130820/77727_1 /ASSEMBLY_ACC=CAM_ASM_000668 /TAXON_ID=98059 /ORGANISM="Dinobryon sp., Strain UTEXLB2267" /LENGTH=66 /DNA_ID=CAMNT_0047376731 /DNA_START=1062 /DNA_END=1262 /DNA_ORIENTATION=-